MGAKIPLKTSLLRFNIIKHGALKVNFSSRSIYNIHTHTDCQKHVIQSSSILGKNKINVKLSKYVAYLICSPNSCFCTFDLIIAHESSDSHSWKEVRLGCWAGLVLSPRISPFNEPAPGEWPGPGLSLMVPVPVSSSTLFQKIFLFASFIHYYSAWCSTVLPLISIRAFIFRILYKGEIHILQRSQIF